MKKIINELLEEKKALDTIIVQTQKRLEKAPEGTLRISRNKAGTSDFYHRTNPQDRKGKYIRRNNLVLAKTLAQKEYDARLLEKSKLRRQVIQDFVEKYKDSSLTKVYTDTSQIRQELIDSRGISDEEYAKQWQSVCYKSKGFDDFAPEIYTDKGERVRSKSEKMIADKLYMRGIPYRYEYPLQLKGYGTIYPDFTILNKHTRKEYLFEHFGRMDDEEYCRKAIQKIENYQKNGIYSGEKLLMTFETKLKPLNMKMVEDYIDNYWR